MYVSDDSMTMYVGNVPYEATENSILELFGDDAESVQLKGKRKATSKARGFVEFSSIESRDAAVAESWELDGHQLIVEQADKKPSGKLV